MQTCRKRQELVQIKAQPRIPSVKRLDPLNKITTMHTMTMRSMTIPVIPVFRLAMTLDMGILVAAKIIATTMGTKLILIMLL